MTDVECTLAFAIAAKQFCETDQQHVETVNPVQSVDEASEQPRDAMLAVICLGSRQRYRKAPAFSSEIEQADHACCFSV